jgi:hypothetical protein
MGNSVIEAAMNLQVRGWAALALVAALSACASPPTGLADSAVPSSGSPNRIMRAEIDRGQWQNVYEPVRNLRPRWIRTRGMTHLAGQSGGVQVYVDGTRLGGVDRLRDLPTAAIHHVAWVHPISAAGRWGLGHGDGVIAVSYRPEVA